MKNKDWGRGRGGGLNREGGVINFPPLKRGVLIREGGAYLRGGFIEDLRYVQLNLAMIIVHFSYARRRQICRTDKLDVRNKINEGPSA